ncbi:isoprenylcysteine carboxyl methyltransferase family protein [Alpinimonas psychrophila]|uniref:Methyltransferase n=1 Tax=Alpinimonas psychrophila TaxID=748908 RepID=A0A7W3JTA9_9MICO|nr:isoprenylcysteine carboxylmethyltransferase family protein [Alpinimonas psychrophila]MBA8828777.1 methyltransferase [Alpinimonas psychrophila]
MSEILYFVLVLATGGERIAELIVSKRNASWSFARGGIEYGRRHFPPMVALHTGLLLACIGEVYLFNSPFIPLLGWPMLALVVASQGLRWWCIASLGPRWNTRVIVVNDLPLVTKGPYRWRWLRHPNYVAVVVEGFALPLVHSAWVTAIVFTVLNAILLMAVRIPCENRALSSADS